MVNKYSKLAKEAREERRRKRMCEDKKPFETKELAFQKGQSVYKCKYCGKWHRSSKLNKLLEFLRGPKYFPKFKIRYKR